VCLNHRKVENVGKKCDLHKGAGRSGVGVLVHVAASSDLKHDEVVYSGHRNGLPLQPPDARPNLDDSMKVTIRTRK